MHGIIKDLVLTGNMTYDLNMRLEHEHELYMNIIKGIALVDIEQRSMTECIVPV